MKLSLIAVILLMSSQLFAQCLVQKTGQQYGFFRVTNFKEKVCWLSEPFAYQTTNGEVKDYDQILACFMQKVKDLGGNIEHDADEFGREKVVWLNNTYDPNDELESSYNWNLASVKACIKYISNEITYKTNSGIKVKIIRMFKNGLISADELGR